jgi:hypothetical protein
VDPKKLVAYNGLEKQMENNTKWSANGITWATPV